SIAPNQIYGLLGRNGAGKTTIMRIITAQLRASSGEVRVFGQEPYENNQVLSQLCFVKDNQKYPDHFRVNDVLEVSSAIFSSWDRECAHALIRDFELPLNRKIKKLSLGMRSS